MGIVVVALFAASAAGVLHVVMMSTGSRTRSAARAASRSCLPSAQRYSRRMFRLYIAEIT
jgi:type II secretory pathway pseudopilin PulG